MSLTRITMPTTERLAAALIIFHQASRSYEQIAAARRDKDDVIAPVRHSIAQAVEADIDERTGKPRFGSDDKRRAETERRLRGEYGDVLVSLAELEQRERETKAACERAYEELHTLRALLRWETAVLEHKTAELLARQDVAA